MRQIYPAQPGRPDTPVDLAAAYAYPPLAAPAAGPVRGGAGQAEAAPRAWVRGNMVASADGAAAIEGLSGGLSGPADQRLFMTLRALADVILVGSATVRAEGYGPARPRDYWPPLRAGRPPSPPVAVVSSRLDVDLASPLFTKAPDHARTIVLTTSAAPPGRLALAARHAEIVVAGGDRVDLAAAVGALARRGLARVLTEGGPALLGQLATAGLLHELCLTVSPLLAGGAAGRIVAGATLPSPRPLRLAHVLEDEGSLFCRYLFDAEGRRHQLDEPAAYDLDRILAQGS